LFQYTGIPPVSLGWDDKPPGLVEIITPVNCKESSNIASNVDKDRSKLNELKACRISTRRIKVPVNRTDDFFMVSLNLNRVTNNPHNKLVPNNVAVNKRHKHMVPFMVYHQNIRSI
jgi:hypothetical protein